jgi:hypothetical protein
MSLFHPLTSLVTTGATEGVAFLNRLSSRRGLFARARARANESGRPLVVVGAPSAGLVSGRLAQYGCGDLPCVDLRGCRDCGALARDVTTPGAIPADDDSAVVFVSYVLEYVNDIDGAIAEIARVAGAALEPDGTITKGAENIYVARLQGWSTLARIVTGARHIVDEAPPSSSRFSFHRVARPPRPLGELP